jgi:asparagine synthase (glutamine-hydrolysing)
MCGIIGTLPADNKNNFRSALNTLTHRGPDDWGIWSSNNEITLGHRRLSILDLSLDGHQPMEYANGRYVIVYNGEIFNFLELKLQLLKKGHSFISQSDTEVLLAAYAEWGTGCLHKFNGMWAFAIWDSKKKELFISRDRFGVKPLFYAFVHDRFVFASEMKAIFPYLEQVRPSNEIDWLINNIFNYETTDKCVIDGIKRFPAGHFGFYKNGDLHLEKYWDTLDHLVEVPQSYEGQVERFRELFINACKIRMRSDVPVGTALSGGLDSSATISTMARIARDYDSADRVSRDWQHAFVAIFPGTPLDESYYAKKVVEHIGIKATFIEIDPLKHWNKIEEYMYLFEELYITSPVPMIETYKAMRDHGVYVTIDGHGADELLAGYGAHLLTALNDCGLNLSQFKNVVNAYRDIFAKEDQFQKVDKTLYLQLYMEALARKLFKLPMQNTSHNLIPRIKQLIKNPGDLSHFLKKAINKSRNSDSVMSPVSNVNKKLDTFDSFNKLLYVLFHETILPTLLRNYDRYSMINGVEIRMPFLDYRMAAYTFSLPWTSKIRDSYTKKIVRDAVAPFMPREVAYRKTKIGFNTPIVDWMKHQLKEYFLDEINSSGFQSCSLINSSEVKENVEKVIFNDNATYSEGEIAWTKFMPYLWEKSLIKRDLKTIRT